MSTPATTPENLPTVATPEVDRLVRHAEREAVTGVIDLLNGRLSPALWRFLSAALSVVTAMTMNALEKL